jgi:DNA-binding response OmpR family regulator
MIFRKAMVISDDPQVKAMLGQILGPAQWTIQDAADNSAALKLVEASRFDLIVTCEKTSAKEDVELLSAIRKIHPHTRVIILTGEATPADVIWAMREHAFSYFSTPFSLESLASIVQCAVEEPCWDDGIEIGPATPDWIRLLVRCDTRTRGAAGAVLSRNRRLTRLRERGRCLRLPRVADERHRAWREVRPGAVRRISYLRTRRAVACRIKDPGNGFSLGEIPTRPS